MQSEFNARNIDAIITDEIDREFYQVQDVISLNHNNNISLEGIEIESYLCSSMDVLSILWDDKLICQKLIELRQEELRNLKTVVTEAKVKKLKK